MLKFCIIKTGTTVISGVNLFRSINEIERAFSINLGEAFYIKLTIFK